MSLLNVIPDVSQVVGVLLIVLLIAPLLMLLIRDLRRARKYPVFGEIVVKSATTNAVHPGIDPADYATSAEQQMALDRLSQLPQFRKLTNGTLVEWGSGACITHCNCPLPPTPHLMMSWRPQHAQGIVSKHGLAHYVAYQERVAAMLIAGQLGANTIPDREGS